MTTNSVQVIEGRPRRTRKPVIKNPPEKSNENEDDDDDSTSVHSFSDKEHESEEEEIQLEKESSPEKVKSRGQRQRSARNTSAHVATDVWLYDAFFGAGSSVKMLVTDWLEMWNTDKNKGMLDLVEMLFLTCNIKENIDVETLFDSDLITDLIKEIDVPEESDSDYLLIRKSEKSFRKNFCEFFRLLGAMSTDLILNEGNDFALINWISALSSSSYRPFRHTATLAGMKFLSGIAKSAQDILEEHATLSQQITSSTPKTTINRLTTLKTKNIGLESIINDIYTIIFVHRYRDIDTAIRQDCLSILTDCIDICPEFFLESSQLRYLGWALSDEALVIRLGALSSMNRICKLSNSAGLRPFIERFKQRLIDMALCDKETAVRYESTKLLVTTYQIGFLENEDLNKFIHLVMSPDAKIRNIVAPVVVEWITQEYTEPLQEVIANDNRYLSLASEKMVELKAISQALAFISHKWYERQENIQNALHSEEIKKMAAFNPADSHLPVRSDAEYSTAIASEVQHVSNWINRNSQNCESVDIIGSENIYSAISALMSEFDVLKRYEYICDILLTDFTAMDDSPLSLTDNEESCLIYAFSASIYIAVESDKGSKRNPSNSAVAANRCLIKYMNRLLEKYAKDFSGLGLNRLCELLNLCKCINLAEFIELRLRAAFDDILSEFKNIFTLHQDTNILLETGKILHLFCGINDNLSTQEKSDDEASLDGSTSFTALHIASSKSVEEIVSFLLESLKKSLSKMKELIEEEDLAQISESDLTEFSSLVSFCIRLHAIMKGCDFLSISSSWSDGTFSCFSEMNQCLEIALHMFKLNSDIDLPNAQKNVLKSNQLLEACVGTLSIEINHLIQISLTNDQNENRDLAEKCKRFYDICEAIASDSSGSIFQVKFSLPARFCCMMAIASHYKRLPSLCAKLPSLSRTPTSSFKEQCWGILFDLVSICVFEMPKDKYNVKLDKTSIMLFQENIWAAFFDCMCLVGMSYGSDFGSQFASSCLALTGFSDDSSSLFTFFASSEQPVVPQKFTPIGVLGYPWDHFCELLIKNVLGSFSSILSNLLTSDQSNRIQLFQNYLDNVFTMMMDSIQKSIDLYLQRQTGDTNHGEKLVLLYTQQLKNWSKQIEEINVESPEEKAFLQQALRILRSTIMNFLNKGVQLYGKRLQEWCILRDDVEDLEMSFQTLPDNSIFRKADPEVWKGANSIVGSLELANSGWRLWGAIGGSLSKNLDVLENYDSATAGGIELASLDDLIENLEQYLSEIDLKPAESDNTWTAYFNALEQLRKGASVIKKASTRKGLVRKARATGKATKKKAALPLIAAGGKKRASRRLSKLAPILEDLSEEPFEEEKSDEVIIEEKESLSPGLNDDVALKRDRNEDDEFPSSPEMGATSKRLRR